VRLCDGAVRGFTDNVNNPRLLFRSRARSPCRALRARIYDDAVRGFADSVGIDKLSKSLLRPGQDPVTLPKPDMTQDLLMTYGKQLVAEQDNVKRVQLSEEYIAGASLAGDKGTSLPEEYQ
jgi:hypothetical protein